MSSQIDVPPEITRAIKLDAFQRRRSEQCLESLAGPASEPFAQKGTGFDFALWIGERLDDAANKRRVRLAHMNLEANNPSSLHSATIGGEPLLASLRHSDTQGVVQRTYPEIVGRGNGQLWRDAKIRAVNDQNSACQKGSTE
jgi:hypothetical protein